MSLGSDRGGCQVRHEFGQWCGCQVRHEFGQ